MRTSQGSLISSVLLFGFCIRPILGVTDNTTILVPEQYQLCKDNACIDSYQQKYNAIIVSRTPTKAAMHPGWPETLVSTGSSIFALLRLGLSNERPRPASNIFPGIIPPAIQLISWTISFRIVQAHGAGIG